MPRNAWTSFVKQCSLYLPPDEVIRFINNGNDSACMKRYAQDFERKLKLSSSNRDFSNKRESILRKKVIVLSSFETTIRDSVE